MDWANSASDSPGPHFIPGISNIIHTHTIFHMNSHSCLCALSHTHKPTEDNKVNQCSIVLQTITFVPVCFLFSLINDLSLPSFRHTITFSAVIISLPHHVISAPSTSRVNIPVCEWPGQLSSVWSVVLLLILVIKLWPLPSGTPRAEMLIANW